MRKRLIGIIVVLSLVLLGELVFILLPREDVPEQLNVPATEATRETNDTLPPVRETTLPTQSSVPVETTGEATEKPVTEETTEETTGETTEPEPEQQRYVLTFVGDCTLGSDPSHYGVKYSLIDTVGEDYDYPFRNVVSYFQEDDFTFANLEGVLADSGYSSGAMFTFRGPTAYTQILTGSSIEAVTLANNHTQDYGKDGYASTKDALDAAEVTYVEKDGTALYTTESGLTIGLYAASFVFDGTRLPGIVRGLRQQGAEIIVAAVHWGVEGSYRPNSGQKEMAHALIDAGVDIVYGSHPHVLQPVEEYKDGIIYYSMANFCFGGNNYPQDLDSAILQQEVIREPDGTVHLGELTRIPVSVSSLPVQNNFQPTPYEEGSDKYLRALSKLDGSFKGGNLVVNYD